MRRDCREASIASVRMPPGSSSRGFAVAAYFDGIRHKGDMVTRLTCWLRAIFARSPRLPSWKDGPSRTPSVPPRARHEPGATDGDNAIRDSSELVSRSPARQQLATHEDVVQCYRTLLGREPESPEVIVRHLSVAPTVWELGAEIIRSHEFQNLQNNPVYDNKLRDYLARNFSYRTRYACFCHNCNYLIEALSETSFNSLRQTRVVLFSRRPSAIEYRVAARTNRHCPNEGEITLEFRASGSVLFLISFTMVPGYAINTSDKSVLLISRMQGHKGRFDEIRKATRELKDVSPRSILFAVAQGIARASGVEIVAGTHSTNSVWRDPGQPASVAAGYDEFYVSIGATGPVDGFYLSNIASPGKPLQLVKRGHRLRTKAKRKFKEEIAEEAFLAWRQLGPGEQPAAAQSGAGDAQRPPRQ
jgi:uncharacterized protein VirK/YbjX